MRHFIGQASDMHLIT